MMDITQAVKKAALASGFQKVGVAAAEQLDPQCLSEWLQAGYHGRMGYMAGHFDLRTDPALLVPGAKSIISLAMNYYTPYAAPIDPGMGNISRYAWGEDYHTVMRRRMQLLLEQVQKLAPGSSGRVFVDSAPIMDKQWAVAAGIGWQGKHSNIITRDYGSWIFLGELVTDLELIPDLPMADYCGDCTRCIQACPTGAIVAPKVVDARRCISYLTIELKAEYEIPRDLHALLGNHVFGCDICQDVCPWNKKHSRITDQPEFQPRSSLQERSLLELLAMQEIEFKSEFRNSPIARIKFPGWQRNIRIALRNARG